MYGINFCSKWVFNCLVLISAGLNMSPVARLKKTVSFVLIYHALAARILTNPKDCTVLSMYYCVFGFELAA